ncbi:MAG: hypothetical protein U0165_17690 [Polyangiaceae bacterium]
MSTNENQGSSRPESSIIPAPEPTAAMYPSGTAPAPAGPALPHERCPHCGSVTFIERSSSLRQVCGICGKARVPIDDPSIKRSDAGVSALARASAARNTALLWTVAGSVLAGFSVLSFVVLAVVLSYIAPGIVATLAAIAASGVPMAIAVAGFFKATRKRAEIAPALEEGWTEVAAELVKGLHSQGREVSIETLAKLTRSTNEQAEHLLASLSARGLVRSRVDDSGLRFEVGDQPLAALGPSAHEQALEEAAMAEAQAAELAAKMKSGGQA